MILKKRKFKDCIGVKILYKENKELHLVYEKGYSVAMFVSEMKEELNEWMYYNIEMPAELRGKFRGDIRLYILFFGPGYDFSNINLN